MTEAVVSLWIIIGIFGGGAVGFICAETKELSAVQGAAVTVATVVFLPVTLVTASIYGAAIVCKQAAGPGRRHQRKVDKKRKRIERMKELRRLDEEYERELDRLIE